MIKVAAAVIIEDGKVFISSRPADKPPAGWEFPGGKLEIGETVADAVKRELLEELGLTVIPEEELYTLNHEHLQIIFIRCSIAENASAPCANENQEFKWVDLTDLPPQGLLKNDIEFWNFLINHKIKILNSPL